MEQPIGPSLPGQFVPVPRFFFFLRCAQTALAFIILAVNAYVLSQLTGYFGGAPASTLFLGLITLFYCGYYVVATTFVPFIYHPIPIMVSEVILKIWWLGNWAGMAYWAGVFNGAGWYGYTYSNNPGPAMGAIAGLAAVEWLLFIATMLTFIVAWIRQSKTTTATETSPDKLEQGLSLQPPPPLAPVPQPPYPVEEKQPSVPFPGVPSHPTTPLSQPVASEAPQYSYTAAAPSQPATFEAGKQNLRANI